MVSLIQLALASVTASLDGASTMSHFVLIYCGVCYNFVITLMCTLHYIAYIYHFHMFHIRQCFSQLYTSDTPHRKEIFTLCYNWATSKIVRPAASWKTTTSSGKYDTYHTLTLNPKV